VASTPRAPARGIFMQNVGALLAQFNLYDDAAVLDAIMTTLAWRGVAVGRAFFASGAPSRREGERASAGARCASVPSMSANCATRTVTGARDYALINSRCPLSARLCCKTRPLFAARLDLSVDQFVGFLPRACNSVDTYAAQGTVGDGGGRQRNLTRRRKF
jgi:hypothetical protein